MTIRARFTFIIASVAALTLLVGTFFLVFLEVPHALHTRMYWLIGSHHYKQEVLASAHTPAELQHAEWDGDGWGGAPVGDWMGYVVYDSHDSLPLISTERPPIRIPGIPCEVVAVRHLEKNWYSVVTNMNQFWDIHHPDCGGYQATPG